MSVDSDSNKQIRHKFNRRSILKKIGILGASGVSFKAKAFGFGRATIPTVTEHRDTIIIGSGFGGAIAAFRLTAKGHSVTILERGRRWDQSPDNHSMFSSLLTPDGRSTWLSNWTPLPIGPKLPVRKNTGVLENNQLSNLQVLAGAAYGGGSVVYGGVLVKPEKRIFEQVFPQFLNYDQLQPYYDIVSNIMQRSDMPQDIYESDGYTHVRVMKQHCDRAGVKTSLVQGGYRWDKVRDEINGKSPGSVTHGAAVYGTNGGGKVTVSETYLAMAEATGLTEVKTLNVVQSLARRSDGLYEIAVDEIDDRGNVITHITYTCHKLFLNAGSVGTSRLLVKAKAKGQLPDLNEHVGEGWGNNGNCYAIRLGIKEKTGTWQGGPPALGIQDFDNEDTPLFIEHPQFPLGFDAHCLLYFSVGINPSRGKFYYDPSTDSVKLDWPQGDLNQQAKVNKALLRVMERLNEANGGYTSNILDGFKRLFNDDAVYHPLGGCVLGKACDEFGRVKNYPGLYVGDGSMMPGTSACTNPSLTIAAIAERNLQQVIQEDF